MGKILLMEQMRGTPNEALTVMIIGYKRFCSCRMLSSILIVRIHITALCRTTNVCIHLEAFVALQLQVLAHVRVSCST